MYSQFDRSIPTCQDSTTNAQEPVCPVLTAALTTPLRENINKNIICTISCIENTKRNKIMYPDNVKKVINSLGVHLHLFLTAHHYNFSQVTVHCADL